MKDFKDYSFAVLFFLLVQFGGAVWFGFQLESRVSTLETKSLFFYHLSKISKEKQNGH